MRTTVAGIIVAILSFAQGCVSPPRDFRVVDSASGIPWPGVTVHLTKRGNGFGWEGFARAMKRIALAQIVIGGFIALASGF